MGPSPEGASGGDYGEDGSHVASLGPERFVGSGALEGLASPPPLRVTMHKQRA